MAKKGVLGHSSWVGIGVIAATVIGIISILVMKSSNGEGNKITNKGPNSQNVTGQANIAGARDVNLSQNSDASSAEGQVDVNQSEGNTIQNLTTSNQEGDNFISHGNITLVIENIDNGVKEQLAKQSEIKKALANEILSIMGEVLRGLENNDINETNANRIGEQLGNVIKKAPISKYQLTESEFTLETGITHFLPNGTNTLIFKGRRAANATAITIAINGEREKMDVGDHFQISQNGGNCSLILHQVSDDYSEATFSYDCN